MSRPSRIVKQGDHLVLVDGSGYLYRAFHALPPLSRASDHHPTGAISGYCAMLWGLMGESDIGAATHMAVIFDAGGRTERHARYPMYKANRPPVPTELARQFGPVRRATLALGLPLVEMKGIEADDIIATYARRMVRMGARCTIVSSDKDLRQLVDENIGLFEPMKRVYLDAAAVKAKMGVPPCYVADYLALVGDAIDNVPGVPGIGEKGAIALITAHGGVRAILDAAEIGTAVKHRDALNQHAASLVLSLELTQLCERIEGLPGIASFGRTAPDTAAFCEFLHEFEIAALAARIERRPT